MSSVDRLKKLITRPEDQTLTGQIVQVSGSMVMVSTSKGVKRVSPGTEPNLTAGESVVISGGTIIGRISDESKVPTYFV